MASEIKSSDHIVKASTFAAAQTIRPESVSDECSEKCSAHNMEYDGMKANASSSSSSSASASTWTASSSASATTVPPSPSAWTASSLPNNNNNDKIINVTLWHIICHHRCNSSPTISSNSTKDTWNNRILNGSRNYFGQKFMSTMSLVFICLDMFHK